MNQPNSISCRLVSLALLLSILAFGSACATSLEGEVPVTPAAAPVVGTVIDVADQALKTADQAIGDVVNGVSNAAASVVISVNNGAFLGHQAGFQSYEYRINQRRLHRGLPPTPESRIASRQAARRLRLGINKTP